jgi:hypothetical protein
MSFSTDFYWGPSCNIIIFLAYVAVAFDVLMKKGFLSCHVHRLLLKKKRNKERKMMVKLP